MSEFLNLFSFGQNKSLRLNRKLKRWRYSANTGYSFSYLMSTNDLCKVAITSLNNICFFAITEMGFAIVYHMLCYVMLCYVMLCYVMLCYVMLCYVKAIFRISITHECILQHIAGASNYEGSKVGLDHRR